MRTNNVNIDKYYQLYKTKRKTLLDSKSPVFDRKNLNKTEFEHMFRAKEADLKSAGESIAPERIVKDIVKAQRYTASDKVANNLVKAMKAKGKDIDWEIAKVYGGNDENELMSLTYDQKVQAAPLIDFFKDIKIRREELKSMGKSGKEIAFIIAQEYYGS